MRKLFLIGAWSLAMVTIACAECPVGYCPATVAFSATEDDLQRMELSDKDLLTAQEMIVDMKSKEDALRAEYHDKATALTTTLAGRLPSRQDVDALSDRLADIIRELNKLRVSYSLDMADVLKVGNLRRIRRHPDVHDSRCEGTIMFPPYRYELGSRERQLIGVTEDEIKYLKDFAAREAYFRAEQRSLRRKLDVLLRAQDVDRAEVASILQQLDLNVRQRTMNRLDRYFYTDKVLFSSDREDKLLSDQHKREQRRKKTPSVRKVKPARTAAASVSSSGAEKKWYWPF